MFSIGGGDTYSAFVSWAKVGLYVGALGLLSTLFLFSGSVTVTNSLLYADLDIDELIREQRISEPYFTTQTERGVDVTLSAAFATPSEDGGLAAQNLLAVFKDADATSLTISAATGIFDATQGIAGLSGAVRFDASDNLTIKTEAATLNLDDAVFQTDAPISGNGPFGQITADRMTLQRTAEGSKLTFTGGIKIVYQSNPND
ncbi:MAG: LPS export ABC transporter periplasmic protein LptC [Planktomarina sp.]